MNNLILREAHKLGADASLIDRLSPYCGSTLAGWALHRVHDKLDKVVPWLGLMAETLEGGWTYYKLKYAFFDTNVKPLSELRQDRNYKHMRETLERRFDVPKFWDSVLPYVHRGALHLAAEIMFEDGEAPLDVAVKLGISTRLAYYLRVAFLESHIEQENDIKHN